MIDVHTCEGWLKLGSNNEEDERVVKQMTMSLKQRVDDFTKNIIVKELYVNDWVIVNAARNLEVKSTTLSVKMKRLNIRKPNPCPKCAFDDPEFVDLPHYNSSRFVCPFCKHEGKHASGISDALEAWNNSN